MELIGPAETAADAELILLAAEALKALEIKKFSIDLTLPTLVPTLCNELKIDEETAQSARAALDHKDAALLADFETPLSTNLIALLKASGPAKQAIAALDALSLPPESAAQVEGLKRVVEQLENAAPELTLTIDPGEYRGFEYQTGLSFTVFARGVRGELGRGGRYLLMDGEHASGFTLFLDSLMRAVPRKVTDDRLYLPFGTSLEAGYGLRQEGWKTVAGLAPEQDIEAEARRLHCGHLFGADGVKKLS